MANVGTAVFEAVGRFGSLIGEAKKASTALDQVSTSAGKVSTAVPADGGQTTKGLSSIQRRAADLAQEMRDSGQNIGSRLADGIGRTLIKGVKIVGAAAGVGLGYTLMKGFKRLAAIEEAEAKLRGLGHTVKGVQQIMDNALKAVLNTKFSLDEAASTAASIVASGIKPGKQLERVLKLVADSAQIAGTSMGEMGLIWSKVAASNKVQGEVINQLTAAGIPIVQMLGKTFHKTSDEIYDMSKKGTITFEMFAKAMEQKLGGSATKAGNTTMGAFENMKIAAARLGATLLKGLFPMAREAFNGIQVWLDKMTEAVKPWAEKVSAAMKRFVEEFKKGEGAGGRLRAVLEGLYNYSIKPTFEWIRDVAVPALQDLWAWAKRVWDALEPWHDTLKKIGEYALIFIPMLAVVGKLAAAISAVRVALAALALLAAANPFVLFIAAIASLVIFVARNWDTIKAKIKEVLDWIPKHAGEIGPKIVSTIKGWASKVSSAIGGLWELITTGSWTQQLQDAFGWKADAPEVVKVQNFRKALGTAFGKVATWIKDEGMPMLGRAASEAASVLWDWVDDVVPNIIDALGDAFGEVKKWLTETAPKWIEDAVSSLGPALWKWIQEESPKVAANLGEWAGKITGWLVTEGIPKLAVAGGKMFAAIVTGIPSLVGILIEWTGKAAVWFITEGVPWMFKMGAIFMGSFFMALKKAIEESELYKSVTGFMRDIGETFRMGWETIKGIFALVWGNIQRWWDEKNAEFKKNWKDLWATVGNSVSLAWGLIKTWIQTRWLEITTWVSEKWAAFKTWVTETWAKISKAVGDAWAKVTKPIQDTWNAIGRWIGEKWATFQTEATKAWDKIVGAVGTAWDKVKKKAATPIEWVVNTVVGDWIRGGYNWLAKLVGLPEWKNFPYVKFASGGVMPGYTPGRDVHEFWSPTGGRLALSGGEAIMRPEFTRAVGGQAGVRDLNERAKRGQMLHFADGGVFQWLAGVGSNIASWGKSAWDTVSAPLKNLLALRDKVYARFGSSDWVKAAAGMIGKLARGVADKVGSIFGGGVNGGLPGQKAPGGRVYIDGKALDPDTARRWNLAEQIAKAQAYIIQGSWSRYIVNGKDLSAGTHLGAGVLDAVAGNWSEWVAALKRVGMLAWFRNWVGNQHIHALNPAVYGSMSAAAQQQVRTAQRGYSGGGVLTLDGGGWIPQGLSLVRNNTGEKELVTPMALLRASERGRLGLERAMAAGARGLLGTAGPPANVHEEINIITHVYNPVAERASDSVQRRLTRTAQLGLIGGRRSGTEG